eukprot:COSAG03_NODE_132_length_11910_cov_9.271103_4_plen_114_part_00
MAVERSPSRRKSKPEQPTSEPGAFGTLHGASSAGTPSEGGTTWSYVPPQSSYITSINVFDHFGPLRMPSFRHADIVRCQRYQLWATPEAALSFLLPSLDVKRGAESDTRITLT